MVSSTDAEEETVRKTGYQYAARVAMDDGIRLRHAHDIVDGAANSAKELLSEASTFSLVPAIRPSKIRYEWPPKDE